MLVLSLRQEIRVGISELGPPLERRVRALAEASLVCLRVDLQAELPVLRAQDRAVPLLLAVALRWAQRHPRHDPCDAAGRGVRDVDVDLVLDIAMYEGPWASVKEHFFMDEIPPVQIDGA